MDQLPPPVMSVLFLHPVLDTLESRGCTPDQLASELGISPAGLRDPKTMILAKRVYEFLAWASDQAKDPHLCARIGVQMARGGWAPINPLLQQAHSVCQVLRRFSLASADQGGAASYRLEIEGRTALWKLTRPRGATANARFADAIAAGLFIELLKHSGERAAVLSDCVAVLSDASLIPEEVLPPANIIAGARGLSLRFPSPWLDWSPGAIEAREGLPEAGFPEATTPDLAAQVRAIIGRNLADPDFGLARIAAALDLPKWQLQRALKSAGSTVSGLRNEARHARAQEMLHDSDKSISEIAWALGYTTPSNFARAFRSRTGLSPQQFRAQRMA